jgi:hypothetical protein
MPRFSPSAKKNLHVVLRDADSIFFRAARGATEVVFAAQELRYISLKYLSLSDCHIQRCCHLRGSVEMPDNNTKKLVSDTIVPKKDNQFHDTSKMLLRLAMENADFRPARSRKGIKGGWLLHQALSRPRELCAARS